MWVAFVRINLKYNLLNLIYTVYSLNTDVSGNAKNILEQGFSRKYRSEQFLELGLRT
jgi:hypothetical protein